MLSDAVKDAYANSCHRSASSSARARVMNDAGIYYSGLKTYHRPTATVGKHAAVAMTFDDTTPMQGHVRGPTMQLWLPVVCTEALITRDSLSVKVRRIEHTRRATSEMLSHRGR